MKKLIAFLILVLPNLSFAYLGPGAGGGIIVATIGLVLTIILFLIGLIWWPMKKFLKKIFKKNKKNNA